MGRLHCPRSASGHHQIPLLGQHLADAHHSGICRIGPEHAVAAHHAYDGQFAIFREKLVEQVADGVVVENATEGVLEVRVRSDLLALVQVVGIYATVVAAGVARRVARAVGVVEVGAGIEVRRHAVGYSQARENDVILLDVFLEPVGHMAAYEYAVVETSRKRKFAHGRKIQVAEYAVADDRMHQHLFQFGDVCDVNMLHRAAK